MKCKKCNELINPKRAKLGYTTCLACGQQEAELLKEQRRERIAPAYNKGPLMYITSKKMVKDLGR